MSRIKVIEIGDEELINKHIGTIIDVELVSSPGEEN